MKSRALVLASSSPRRQELIRLLGRSWTVKAANIDESSIDIPEPETNVIETARLKANHVAASSPLNALIIAADTTVVLDGRMLNKPKDAEEARDMLLVLRGRAHQVHTGIVVIDNYSAKTFTDICSVDVPMRDYDLSEIVTYIGTGDPLDKAGAYAIQHPVFQPVEELTGCYASVVGLPLCHLVRLLLRLEAKVTADVPLACQNHHNYQCPVYRTILSLDDEYGTM
jgi:MAF protein